MTLKDAIIGAAIIALMAVWNVHMTAEDLTVSSVKYDTITLSNGETIELSDASFFEPGERVFLSNQFIFVDYYGLPISKHKFVIRADSQ